MLIQLRNLLLFIFLLLSLGCLAQANFKSEFRKADPLGTDNKLTITEKIEFYEGYLNEAKKNKNIVQEFYGHLYLFLNHYKNQDYTNATNSVLQAGIIAQRSQNPDWIGAIYLRKGALSSSLNFNDEEALGYFIAAVKYCTIAKDSLCMCESMEQVATAYGNLEKYDSAHYYYKRAMPMLEKFADSQQMATTYNNYSNLLSHEGMFAESIRYIEKAITIALKNKDTYKLMMYMNNKGSHYADMGQYDKAIEIYESCIPINQKNKWTDRLVHSYIGLFEASEKKGDYRSAFEYIKTFYLLKDSLMGNDVSMQIADLQVKYESAEKELALAKSKDELLQSEHLLRVRSSILFALLILTFGGILLWWLYSKKKKNEIKRNKQDLNELTEILIRKNALITELEEVKLELQNTDNQTSEISDFEINILNQRILTNDDWASFKMHFEKAYPGYLRRVRTLNSSLTEAEERLFIFIKLKLNTKETSSILGISTDSVKKARNRLRKKLELSPEIELDTFVSNF